MTARSWRILGRLSVGAAVGVLAGASVYGLVAVNGSGYGTATTGTLLLSLSAPASQTCTFTSLTPGDLDGTSRCSMTVVYTGSTTAFVSLTVGIRSRAAAAGQPLYDGSNATGLTFTLDDGHHAFTVPTGAGAACADGFTCWTADHDLVASYDPADPLVFTSGDQITFVVTPYFLRSAGNPYQGGTADLTLVAEAVQAPANALPPGCTTSTIGQPCPAGGSFSWS